MIWIRLENQMNESSIFSFMPILIFSRANVSKELELLGSGYFLTQTRKDLMFVCDDKVKF